MPPLNTSQKAYKRVDNYWGVLLHQQILVYNLKLAWCCIFKVDVIESQFSILQDKIHATRDFEAIRYAHENFLTSLLNQSFLLMKPVSILHTKNAYSKGTVIYYWASGIGGLRVFPLEKIMLKFIFHLKMWCWSFFLQ